MTHITVGIMDTSREGGREGMGLSRYFNCIFNVLLNLGGRKDLKQI